ncbi:hypothetical protein GWC95_14600 [Sediminibacterium roseum]|uniref:DUF3592 domain-containing protein n=1 Tax=Sediminibacterium roseum TaxID=1978412 RepID=A0ABW9ZVX5_9BACT|nr:hypothetical protein [Sediminibacterium roseum]NCI51159.1 hypothetical protein [Sediminibacterium roseum]
MNKLVFILYLVCFGCYILFTRQPDYFDGEKVPAVIHWSVDSLTKRSIPKALYRAGLKNYAIDARYVFRNWAEGDKAEVIYETNAPAKGAVYAWWGYWITWGELVGSVLLIIALFQVAVSVTKNPTPEALIEQLDYKEERKPKYKREDE